MSRLAYQNAFVASKRLHNDRSCALSVVKPISFGFQLFIATALFSILNLTCITRPVMSQESPSQQYTLFSNDDSLQDAFNPNPLKNDIELPMPCSGKMILRPVCVASSGFFEDLEFYQGCTDCGRWDQGFMEGKHKAAVSGPFNLRDLPNSWRSQLAISAESGNGQCPNPNDESAMGFYYFIGKYEVSNFQWDVIMDGKCPGSHEPLSANDARPKTGISWFEAIDFTRRYTEWLLKNSPDLLPKFSRGRFGYLRLPTETEWEYAARGGHMVTEPQLNHEEFFPLNGHSIAEYAVFTNAEAPKPPEKIAWIGSKRPNPLGLFDTAGNASEMVLDPFRFTVGFRLHGTAGGFVVKGGSYLKRKAEIMPGRREEMPFFLKNGAFNSGDLGFRIVLSGIVTPDDRNDTLIRQWARKDGQIQLGQLESRNSESMLETDQVRGPISEFGSLADTPPSVIKKENLLLKDIIRQNNIMLIKQKTETINALIWNAILITESVSNYLRQRKEMLEELQELEEMKTETVHESVLDGLDSNITKKLGTVCLLDAEINIFLKFYISRIKDFQKYPEGVFESQLSDILNELNPEEILNISLKPRLNLLKKHVTFYRDSPEILNQEKILKDINITYAH